MYSKNKLSFSYLENTKENKDTQHKKYNTKKWDFQKKNNTNKNFPLFWTCYQKENGDWKCPMNGD